MEAIGQPGDVTISIEGATVARGGRVALTVDSLDLRAGLTAVVGPNGSGKSTLLHLVAGLLTPATGSVSVLGRPPDAARREIAYVLQSPHHVVHLPITAGEVVELGRAPAVGPFRRLGREDRRLVADAMERLEVADLAHRHLSEMSGGQRQRVLIAQGLAQRAQVLLLDEPVAGLDLASMQAIDRELAVERDAGRTIVLTTHDLNEAWRADAAVLLAGRVVAAGAPADVLTPARLREAYEGRILDLDGHVVALDDGAHHDAEHHHFHRHEHHDHHHDDHHDEPA